MTKTKKIVFFLLIVLIIGYISYPYFFQKENTPLTIEQRNKDKNTAYRLELEAGHDYKVDNKKFKQGFYDITCLKGNARINNVYLDKGDKFLGVPFYSNNSISVEGKGTVLLEPAEFNKISLQDDKFILDNESGIFQAGMEIEPGNYELHVEGNMPFYVFVGVNNYDENSKNPKSFDIKDTSNEIKFTLKDEDILKIFNWSNNKTDFTVNLIKKED